VTRHVLLLDDEEDIGIVLSAVLAEDGYTTDYVRTALGAIKLLRERVYDCAIVDIGLGSEMTSLDVLREVVRLAPPPLPPVVILTAWAPELVAQMLDFDPELARVMFRGRPPVIVLKPPSTAELLAAIEEATS
jgi:CheY-like chemotaxis protein